MRNTAVRAAGLGLAAGLVTLGATITASAHVQQTFGSYKILLGWAHEPTYVGQPNAVQLIVRDSSDQGISDLGDDDFKVTVTFGSQNSDALPMKSAFDSDTGLGIPGDYEASITPTQPGNYTFHVRGTIKNTPVDYSATSSDTTFDTVHDLTPIEFPAKVPAAADLSTRLDRVDQRLSSISTSSTSAHDDANHALVVGIIALVAGLVVGGAGIGLALRPRRGV